MVVRHLDELLSSSPSLTVAVLDCYANLSLPSKLLGPATVSVLNKLASCERRDLPAVVSFLLQVRHVPIVT